MEVSRALLPILLDAIGVLLVVDASCEMGALQVFTQLDGQAAVQDWINGPHTNKQISDCAANIDEYIGKLLNDDPDVLVEEDFGNIA